MLQDQDEAAASTMISSVVLALQLLSGYISSQAFSCMRIYSILCIYSVCSVNKS